MGENNKLKDLVLETVPKQHHDELCESMKNLGPEITFFTKVYCNFPNRSCLRRRKSKFSRGEF